jgi:hypothetical protein
MGAVTSLNLLQNNIPEEQAKDLLTIMSAREEKLKHLCGMIGEKDELDFSNKKYLDVGDVMLLANGINKNNAKQLHVKLSNNRLKIKAHLHIADMLKRKDKTCLERLDYSGNDMSIASGAQAFADGLKDHTALLSLNLSKNRIGSQGAKAIAGALKVCVSIVPTHISLRPKLSQQPTRRIPQRIHTSRTVRLYVYRPSILRCCAPYIQFSHSLTLKTALAYPQACGALTELDASHNIMFGGTKQIHKSGIKAWAEAIKTHLSLTDLNISSNFIDAKDVEILGPAVRDNTVLLILVLKDNRLLTAEAGKALSEMVAANTTLEKLDVSKNGWEVDGKVDGRVDGPGFAKRFSVGLAENQSLSSLHIGLNTIPEEEMMRVIDIAMRKDSMKFICEVPIKDKTFTTLDLSGKNLGVQGARVVDHYLRGAQVATLNMSKNMLLTKEGGKVIRNLLKDNTVLKDLDVSKIHMEDSKDQDVPGFAKEIAEGLSMNNGVLRLNLCENRMATKDAGQALENVLKANTTLKELDVSSNQFDGADGPGFAQGVFRGIAQNRTLTSLDVSNNNLGDLVLPGGWVHDPHCFGLNLHGYTHTADGTHAKFRPGKPEGVIAVIDALLSSSLSSVNLLENNISIKDAHTLANILKDETTNIKSLCGNKGDETKLDMGRPCSCRGSACQRRVFKKTDIDGAIMLAAEIANNEVLEELSFGNNGGDHVYTIKTDMSKANLSGMGLGVSGAIMLSAFIPKCT